MDHSISIHFISQHVRDLMPLAFSSFHRWKVRLAFLFDVGKKKNKPMVNMKFLQRVIFIKTKWLRFLENIHCRYNNPAVKPDKEVNENQNADDNVRLLSFPEFLHIPRGSFNKENINHIRVLYTLFVVNIHQQMHVSPYF